MWTLLKKNFWLWRPSRSANWFVFSVALAFSCVDAFVHFSSIPWAIMFGLSVLIAMGGASSAMNVDLKHDNIQFLEYLPIRWSHVWFANWLDQLLACLLLVPLLCWCRILTWSPPSGDQNNVDDVLFTSRWLLPVALSTTIYFNYSYALLWRTLFKSDKAALIPTYLGGLAFIALPLMLPLVMFVWPTLWDIWPLLILQGTIFSLCSFIIFAFTPRFWSTSRRFLIAGLPLLLISLCIEIVSTWHCLSRLEPLDWSEPRLSLQVLPSSIDHRRFLTVVHSEHSGEHYFAFDLTSNPPTYLGRNLQFLTQLTSFTSDEPFVAHPNVLQLDWWPLRSPVFALSPDSSSQTNLFDDNSLNDESGRPYTIVKAAWAQHGNTLLLSATDPRNQNRTALFICDKLGHFRKRFDLFGGFTGFLLNQPDTLLIATPSDPPKYLLYNLASQQETPINLPGRPICFSGDLSQCLCTCTANRDAMNQRSVVLFELNSQHSRVVIPEGILPPISLTNETLAYRSNDPLPSQSGSGLSAIYSEPVIALNANFTQAAIAVTRYDRFLMHESLLLVDLTTNARHVLVPESDLDPVVISSIQSPLELWGFTPDAKACVYKTASKIVHVNLSDGHPLTTPLPVDCRIGPNLSPNGWRIILMNAPADSNHNWLKQTWQVLDVGNPQPIFSVSDDSSLEWLDDDHLMKITSQKMLVTDIHGHVQRQVFPPKY